MLTKGDEQGKKLQQLQLLWKSCVSGEGTQESRHFFFVWKKKKKKELNYLLV